MFAGTTSLDLENLVTFVYSVSIKPFHNLVNYINTVSNCSNLFTITVRLAGKMVSALLDSGCSVTIMSDNFFKSIPIKQRPSLQPYTGRPLRSASGHLLSIVGNSQVSILVGKYTTILPFLVVQNFPYDVLLGNDTFLRLRCSIDFNDLILKSPYGFSFRMYATTQMEHSTARLCSTITIPPWSALKTMAICDEIVRGSVVVVEPQRHSAILQQRTICQNRPDRLVHIFIINTSRTQSLKICKNQAIATASSYSTDVNSVDIVPDVNKIPEKSIEQQLNELDLDTDSALDPAMRIRLRTFLLKNKNVFAPKPRTLVLQM